VVGTVSDANGNQAFLYTNGPNVRLLGSLAAGGGPGSSASEAYAISTSGQVVGYAINTNSEYHAFRWTTNNGGKMVDLGTLGGTYSEAWSINSSNTIVGKSYLAGDAVEHAFVTESNTLLDLNSLLDASGSNWVLIKAEYINDLGQIAGYGTYNGVKHGFLATPKTAPAPVINLTVSGTNSLVRFTTVTGATYYLEMKTNLASAAWNTNLVSTAGSGGTKTLTNSSSPGAPAKFFRVRVTVP
jgi:probable HAF family extracellular repeat protein